MGLPIGEGHFGGDGRQPQVTLRMHVAHESLFRWLERPSPAAVCTVPMSTAAVATTIPVDGMWRLSGEVLVPRLDRALHPDLDAHASLRYQVMKARYGLDAAVSSGDATPGSGTGS